MNTYLRPAAQAALLVVIGSTFLPWSTSGADAAGTQFSQGQLAAAIAFLSIGAIQLNWRPAWMGAGFVLVVLGRLLINLGDAAGIGLWLAVAGSAAASALLVAKMFREMPRGGPSQRREEPE